MFRIGDVKHEIPVETSVGMQKLAIRHNRLSVSVFFLNLGMIFGTWASCIPSIKERFGLTDAELGNILFAIPAGQLIAMGLSAWIIKRIGSRRALQTGALLIPVIMTGAVLSDDMIAFITLLILFGMCDNLYNIAANTQGVNVEHSYGRTIMSSFHGLFSLGGFAGALFGLVCGLFNISVTIQLLSVLLSSFAMVLIFGRKLVIQDYIPQKKTSEENCKQSHRIDGYVFLLGVIALCAMICEGVMYDWSGVFFKDVVQARSGLVQTGYAICMGCMTLGRFLVDRFVEKYGARAVVRVSGIMICIGLLGSSIYPIFMTAALSFAIIGLGISATVPICYSVAGRGSIYNPSTALTIVTSIGFFGFLAGPPLIGYLASTISLRWTFTSMALMGIAVAVLASVIHRKE